MSRLSFPTRSGLIVAEPHGKVLHQAVKRNEALCTERPSRSDLLWRKDFKEETQMRPMANRRRPEITCRSNCYRELRKHVVAAGD
jgi:hypothetical protein